MFTRTESPAAGVVCTCHGKQVDCEFTYTRKPDPADPERPVTVLSHHDDHTPLAEGESAMVEPVDLFRNGED